MSALLSSLSNHTVESALLAIVSAFDTYGGEVDTNAFVSGSLLLLAGPKRESLSLALHLFDADTSRRQHRRSVWKFLRMPGIPCKNSILCTVEEYFCNLTHISVMARNVETLFWWILYPSFNIKSRQGIWLKFDYIF